jgi:DNA polymerase-3 subunit delta'
MALAMSTIERTDPSAVLPGIDAHPHARAVLGAALPPQGSPSHAYLFHGPHGAGKRTVARSFAAALLADGAADPGSVSERVRRGAHPDLTWVTPSGAAEMLVSDIDEAVVAAATRTPFESSRRVFVIEGADAMNDQAANRMLKTLEEPAAFVHLILLAERPGDLLATIASRCQAVRFDPPPVERIAARLAGGGVEADVADACARLSLGDGRTARRLAGEQGRALRAAAERLARDALGGQPGQRAWAELLDAARAAGERAGGEIRARAESQLELVPERERRRHLREADDAVRRAERRGRVGAVDLGLGLAGLWLRDCACVADGVSELVHATDRMGALREDATGRDGATLRRALAHVEDTRRGLAVNVSEELALDALSQRLSRVLA